MKVEVNKRIEQNMVEIIKILDDMTSRRGRSRADGGTSSKETLETYEDEDG